MSYFATDQGTVTFTATTDSWSEPHKAEVNVLGFPGGNSVAISVAGKRETRRTFKVLLDDATDFATFDEMLADPIGSLYIDGWDVAEVPAVLIGLTPDPIWHGGEVTCTAQFILY